MSMDTYLFALRPPDERWRQMKAVWEACEAAGVAPPNEVLTFFDNCPPDPTGVAVNITGHPCCEVVPLGEETTGLQVDLKKLPDGVRYLRFVNEF